MGASCSVCCINQPSINNAGAVLIAVSCWPGLQDLNPAYNMLLRSELLGCHCPSPISPDKATQLEQLRGTSSPGKKILCFKTGNSRPWYLAAGGGQLMKGTAWPLQLQGPSDNG